VAIEWSDDYALGIAEIDEQHQALIDQTNALMGAMREAKGKQAVEQMLSFLGDYVLMHFATEESLMARLAYPGLAAHREQHETFIKTLGELRQELARTGPTSVLAITVNARVGQWLIKHVLSVDQALGRFVRDRKEQAG